MAHYVRLGDIPRKRHTQFRKPDGSLYAEEVFGTEGFSGISSTLYHAHLPTRARAFEPVADVRPETLDDPTLRHRHLKTAALPRAGDPVSGRVTLLANDDVSFALAKPVAATTDYFYKNADGDELLFIHEGNGRVESVFGTLSFAPGDYVIVPRGIIHRLAFDSPATFAVIESSASNIEPPKRYRNAYGQLLEHAPYCERDIRTPETLDFHDEPGDFLVHIKARGRLTAYRYDFHPLDVVGWDGFVYPWALSIHDFEPITGSIHQPPPAHQTFSGNNFVVCSFVPRLLDYHPDAVPIPYNHSNLDSDEVLYYVNGNFASRRGIETGSITLHPSGLPHGPQPGAVEASLGKTRTDELAVMLDTFRPLRLTRAAAALDDNAYPMSWT